jgi:hypothetical protein
VEFEDFISLADEYSGLGWSVQEQMKDVASGSEELDEQNPNAVRLFQKFARDLVNAGVWVPDEVFGEAD